MRKTAVVLTLALAAALAGCRGTSPDSAKAGADAPLPSIKIMVGGIDKVIYLPAKLTEQLGGFQAEGLTVQLLTEPSGATAENVLISGDVQGVVGFYDHTIDLQTKGKCITSVVQFADVPGEVEMVAAGKASSIRSPADFKGKKMGVTSPGSSTDFLTQYLATKAGLTSADYTTVKAQAGQTFIAAIDNGGIDAGMTTDPTAAKLVSTGKGKVLLDMRTEAGAKQALGGLYPASSLYMDCGWVQSHPEQVQKLANAFVKTLRWIKGHSADEIAAKMPAEYAAGDTMNPMRRAPEQTPGPMHDAPDYIVLAVPPAALALLVENGEVGRRIVDRVPHLSELQRLNSEPIAVLDLYFTRKLDGLPRENVAMVDSTCDLSFLDLSQLWDNPAMRDVTVLTVAASDYWALSSEDPEQNGQAMIQTLHDYLPLFDPGAKWGQSADIDWTRTHYESNKSDTLFINQVGSEAWRPHTHYAAVSNLFFAGDLCLNKIDMATVEAAVTSGLNAAIAIQQKDPLGDPIKIAHLPTCPETAILAMKLLMAPSALLAARLSTRR